MHPIMEQSFAVIDREIGEHNFSRSEYAIVRRVIHIGNAPTALLALCNELPTAPVTPALVIGAPVGFISVLESKAALAHTPVNQIRVEGRKGGSPVAAAILNALIVLAWEEERGGVLSGAGEAGEAENMCSKRLSVCTRSRKNSRKLPLLPLLPLLSSMRVLQLVEVR